MASDQQVSARAILLAEAELRRLGHRRVMQQLEQVEPDLMSYVFEELSAIHRRLLKLGDTAEQTQRCYRRVQRLVLVSILSMRHGHHELWRDLMGGSDDPDEVDPSDQDLGD